MANYKRKRSANWMASEKTQLVDLVTEHFHVIENKRTDGVSMKQKLAEWTTISNKYNSQTTLSHRTAENLKSQWESLKKATKKEASFKRMHLIKTGKCMLQNFYGNCIYKSTKTCFFLGGGPSRPKIDDPLQERILGLITPSAVGLHNPYDKDNVNVTENITESFSAEAHKKDELLHTIPGPEVQTKSTHHVDTNETMNNVDWGDYTPNCLKTPVSEQLKPSGKKRPYSGKRLEWMSKRRPQLTRASLENLQELKGKAINVQIEHAANEREEAKKLFEIQMDIQQEILKQEKIKTRLLLLELRQKKRK
ncbi:uncharacterized protein LOC113503221 isoform X1 [Trichoplusia ni]|uniref:Regulatory protein zeste n=1 Tax=Trichoplusia ni TaxID=7111 RepID=A0A7E5V9R2_TRINI|nr:uncharacterized protein LOC113491981 isoform X1 [Trichoplusia ni]XP_026728114.1 uncharacterized protein LOC113494131 isoform X1 [Trichoplusia ni]XP_026731924.1 uncharacterized protein LOC113496799 isoform X1 [Trichoplusia ni]XP_026735803.1 uncharacterized protein LOC113499496 isoform X1 [Trichoplusia ni]XP_026737417.1 uncharacterized protein LOC113500733 isoform X1 [Trichoplusia ni]XP_026739700.1 uncharacterized protein LOC113502355 isoform X1 [Trichoplusia ni]XP_026740915.1 uncharacterize